MTTYKRIVKVLHRAEIPLDTKELARRSGCRPSAIPSAIHWRNAGEIKITHTGRRTLYQIKDVPKTKDKEVD